MRWIRKRSLIAAGIIILYFLFHSGREGSLAAFALVLSMLIVFGSAFFDRLMFDPSAIYIEKPWRLMRPSAGDVFRLFCFGFLTTIVIPLAFIRGSVLYDAAVAEAAILSLVFFLYELSRHQLERVRWHGSNLDIRSKFGFHVVMRWSDIISIQKSIFGEYLIIRDKNGQTAKINSRLNGFSEFLRDAERYVPNVIQADIRALK
jgi:hypothetical protein